MKARPAWAKLPLQKNHNWLESRAVRTLYLGRLSGCDCWAAELAKDAEAPPGMSWEGLRTLFSVLDDAHFALAGRALQLVDWDRTHQFCGRCGAPTAVWLLFSRIVSVVPSKLLPSAALATRSIVSVRKPVQAPAVRVRSQSCTSPATAPTTGCSRT